MLIRWCTGFLLVLVIAAAVVSCSVKSGTSHPTALIMLPGARDLLQSEEGGVQKMSYKLIQKYPAKAALNSISAGLSSQGWKPLKEDFLNPGLPSSHVRGWGDFTDSSRPGGRQEVRQWIGDWRNAKGDVVNYGLQYRWPSDKPKDLDTLHVAASLVPAQTAKEMRDYIIKETEKQKKTEQ